MKYFKILISIIFFASCEEYFEPNLDEQISVYAFEGLITDQPGPYRVRIIRTTGYNNNRTPDIVRDAKVIVECNDGKSYKLTINNDGYYLTDSAMFAGEPGKSYKLLATTTDGKTFTSSWEKLLPCPDIEDITAKYYEEKVVSVSNPNQLDETLCGICAMNNTNAAEFTPYYRYECKIVLQVHQHYPGAVPVERFVYRPLDLKESLFIADANNYVYNNIFGNQLYKTSNRALQVGIDSLVPGMTEFVIQNCGEYIRVKQYSMDEKQYKYWKAVKDQQDNKNYFFGQIENQPIGNISCDTEEQVLGYFCVSAIKENFGAFGLKESKKVVRKYEVSRFPDTDTIAYYDHMQDFTIMFEN